MEKYRDKLSRRANYRSHLYDNRMDELKNDIYDLKKYGSKSDTYYREVLNKADELDRKVQRELGDDASDDQKAISSIMSTVATGVYYSKTAESQVDRMIRDKSSELNEYKESAKAWSKTRDDIMNMTINPETSKKKKKKMIKQIYRQ